MTAMNGDFEHCAELVRTGDKDRFLADLFAPAAERRALFALHAFNLETARIPELVREPLAGEVRLQWWRDVIAGAGRGEVSASPVAAALLATMREYALDGDLLVGMLDARSFDLYREPMPSLAELDDHMRKSSAALFALGARILGADEATARPACEQAGYAWAITTLLRALPSHASAGRLYLPRDMLDRHAASSGDILAGRTSPALLAVLTEMRSLARQRLASARAALSVLPGATVPAFLPLALVEAYLAAMERPGFDPLRTAADVSQWRRQWLLWRAARQPRKLGFC